MAGTFAINKAAPTSALRPKPPKRLFFALSFEHMGGCVKDFPEAGGTCLPSVYEPVIY